MSESIIADFVGTFNAETTARAEPVKGRVLLSQRRLVLAVDADDKLTIPLTSVFDVAVGHVPPDLGDFFDSTVTVAFERHDDRHVAVVEADDETIGKFSTVLFKALLNGTEVSVTERARVGGRVTGADFETARLYLSDGSVEFRRPDGSFTVDLGAVTDFDRTTREVGGSSRPVLAIGHVEGSQTVYSTVAMPSQRKMSLFGRFVRLEYRELVQDLADVDLEDTETELLVAIYSGAGTSGVSLANLVGGEAAQVTMRLRELAEEGLVEEGRDGPQLTTKGKVVVTRHMQSVNG